MRFIIFTALLVFSSTAAISQQPAKVTILGVHHFHNPNADMFNIFQDDVKAPKRQREIKELVDRLLQFKPTKVVIEKRYDDTMQQVKYESFLSHLDEEKLSRNEKEQVGFRVAAKLNHDRIYPFDFKLGMNLSELQDLASRDSIVGQKFQTMFTEMGQFIAGVSERLKYSTMLEFMVYMNLQESIDYGHSAYLEMLNLTGKDSYGASAAVSDWYKRNIHMFYNLNRITDHDADGERILVIVGQGHKAILQDLIEDAPYYEYVDVVKILESSY